MILDEHDYRSTLPIQLSSGALCRMKIDPHCQIVHKIAAPNLGFDVTLFLTSNIPKIVQDRAILTR